MKTRELLGKTSKELKKLEKTIKEGIETSQSPEEKKVLNKDLQRLTLINGVLNIKGVKDVLLNNASPRQTLAGLKDEEIFFLVNNILSLQKEGDEVLNRKIVDFWKVARYEKNIRKQFSDFLALLKDHPYNEVCEQGWRVLKVNSPEGKNMASLLSRFEQIMERRFKNRGFLDLAPNEIGQFTQIRQEITALTEKFKKALKELQNYDRNRRKYRRRI
ncbi:MAG TPA: hypothetical protein P5150_09815 [Candidatus Ratteibacteria bacterium]|nr:hypothetical protein [Candidatus Ratteibacteria bacterium]